MKRWLTAMVLALVGCAQAPQTYRDLDRIGQEISREEAAGPQNAEQATAQDYCGASHFRNLVGRPAGDIDQTTLPARTRIIRPGMMITQDFSPQRLNIRVAPDGNVTEVACF